MISGNNFQDRHKHPTVLIGQLRESFTNTTQYLQISAFFLSLSSSLETWQVKFYANIFMHVVFQKDTLNIMRDYFNKQYYLKYLSIILRGNT